MAESDDVQSGLSSITLPEWPNCWVNFHSTKDSYHFSIQTYIAGQRVQQYWRSNTECTHIAMQTFMEDVNTLLTKHNLHNWHKQIKL